MITNLKDLRESKGISQQVISQELGISRQTFSRIEKGEADLSLGQAVKLSEMLGVSLDDLLGADSNVESTGEVDREKYKQIIRNCIRFGADADGKITKTKLAKLCYLVDFAWFYNNLESITGLQYRRIDQGPVPDAYFATMEELEEEEAIAIERKGKAYMIENLSQPSDDSLSTDELDLIKKICAKWQGFDTRAIVEFTHKQMPWMVCRDKELIPYEFITQEEPENVY